MTFWIVNCYRQMSLLLMT